MRVRDLALCVTLICAPVAWAQEAAPAPAAAFSVTVEGIDDGSAIDARYGACEPAAGGLSQPGKNERPAIAWQNLPAGTQSVAVFLYDTDVPQDFSDAGQPGRVIAQDAPRRDRFFHYAAVNIAPQTPYIRGGNPARKPPSGLELANDMGANGYVKPAYRYGGPCPPWNDERLHHYHLEVLALSTPATGKAAAALAKLPANAAYASLSTSKQVLGVAQWVGTYSLWNPPLTGVPRH